MKRIKWLYAMIFMMILLCGCGMEKPLEIDAIKEEKTVIAYFEYLNMSIEDMEIVKRQTNEDDKTDILYANVKFGNNEAKCEAEFVFESFYYDEGGWIVENVIPNEPIIYEPKGEPDVEGLLVGAYEESRYDNTNLIDVEQEDTYTYNVDVIAYINGIVCDYMCSKCDVVFFDNTIGKWMYTISSDEESTMINYFLKDMEKTVLETYSYYGGDCSTTLYVQDGEVIISEVIHEGEIMEIKKIDVGEKTAEEWRWYVRIRNPRRPVTSGRTLTIIIEVDDIKIEC